MQPENNQLKRYKEILHQYLSPEEIKAFHQKSNAKALWEVASAWLWIAFALILAGVFSHPLTILLAVIILSGKQLACAIILHDASHHSLFKTKKLNDFFGNWLGGYPILQNVKQYRPYHLQHHVATGTSDDPDINLTLGYPATEKSMVRKFGRDLIGLTGLKALLGVLLMHLGIVEYNLGNKIVKVDKSNITFSYLMSNAVKNLSGPLLFHLLFLGLCILAGQPWLYALWWISYLTLHQLILRIRSMAEHSMVEDRLNPLANTRTTYANFIERLLFAPLHVNYHAEHHLMVAAPCYNYPKLHRILKERGYFNHAPLANGYREIIQKAVKSA